VERFINELAVFLAGRGHDVTVVCGKPGRTEIVRRDGFTTIYCRRLWHPALSRLGLLEFHAFFVPAFFRLLRGRYDVALCCTFMDGFAAQLCRSALGMPYVFAYLTVPPPVRHFRSLSLKGAVHGRAVRGADAVVSLSRYVQEYCRGRWGVPSVVLPVPVDLEKWRSRDRAPAPRPTLLCAAALDDPRKGGRLLLRAFELLKQRRPDVTLQLAWAVSPELQKSLLDLVSPAARGDVEFLGTAVDLQALFARAWVSVLPSLQEAQGMVLVESLAAGMSVVGTRDGALPEIITDARIGRLFDPGPTAGLEPTNVEGLARALEEALDLSRRPETVEHCRRRAMDYSWETVGLGWEQVLRGAALAGVGA
jgi:glycosyltransferase involved in cell wall biosynthesis